MAHVLHSSFSQRLILCALSVWFMTCTCKFHVFMAWMYLSFSHVLAQPQEWLSQSHSQVYKSNLVTIFYVRRVFRGYDAFSTKILRFSLEWGGCWDFWGFWVVFLEGCTLDIDGSWWEWSSPTLNLLGLWSSVISALHGIIYLHDLKAMTKCENLFCYFGSRNKKRVVQEWW